MVEQFQCAKCGTPLAESGADPLCPKCREHSGPVPLAPGLGLPPLSGTIRSAGAEAPEVFPFAKNRRFGDYQLLEVIARGGMGVVYKARQLSLNRLVALKMIRSAHLASEAEVERFRAEARAAGGLDHPNIVPVYEVGELDGQYYFSMKLVEGGSLADHMLPFCSDHRAAARLLAAVARAIHYAHQCGILHRDLKPANILIDDRREPHVTDFGLAKRLGMDSDLTMSGAVLGTPNYMAPEQAAGQTRRVTTAADIYSLGAVFYQLLTGKPPFEAATSLEVIRKVVDQEPPPPSSINLLLDRDLETICLKCLEKDPQKRFHSAADLADDLDRWLRHEPISARPAGWWEYAGKWVRRRPALASLIGVCLVAGLGIFILTLVNRARLQRERDNALQKEAIANRERERAEKTSEQLGIQVSEERFSLNEPGDGLANLVQLLRKNPHNYVAANRLFYAMEQMPFEIPLVDPFGDATMIHATFSHDGRLVATVTTGTAARIWDATTGKPVFKPFRYFSAGFDGVFSGDDRLLAVTGSPDVIRVWDVRTGTPAGVSFDLGNAGHVMTRALFADGDRKLITVSRGRGVYIWETATGKKLAGPLATQGDVIDASLSPDQKHLVTASFNGSAQTWEVETGRPVGAAMKHDGLVLSAEFSPDGKRLVTASTDNTARLWDGRTGAPLAEPLRHHDRRLPLGAGTNWVWLQTARIPPFDYVWIYGSYLGIPKPLAQGGTVLHARFSPDGQRVVTACFDGTVWVWDGATCQPLFEPIRHQSLVRDAEFGPEGQRFLTASYDGTARVWDALTGQPLTSPLKHDSQVWEAHFSPDGRRVVTAGGQDKTVRLWDAGTGNALPLQLRHRDSLSGASFSADGRRVLTASHDKTARLWDAQSGRPLTPALPHQNAVVAAAFSPDASFVVTGTSEGEVTAWNVGDGSRLYELKVSNEFRGLAINGSGTRLLTFDSRAARLWDAKTGAPLSPDIVHVVGEHLPWACLDREGSRLVTAGWHGNLALWDAQTGQELVRIAMTNLNNRHGERINFAQFSPDGKRLVSASSDGSARVWDSLTCQPVTPPLRHGDQVQHAVFSPDASLVATASLDGTAKVWNARTGELLTEPLRHKGWVWAVAFSPDGRRVATASYDRSARVWDVRTGKPLTYPLAHAGEVNGVSFSPDGRRLLTSSLDGSARIFEVPEAPTPVPAWFLDLAGVVGGRRINEHGFLEAVSLTNLSRLKILVQQRETGDFYTRWAKWLFADRATRTISAFGQVAMPEYIELLIADNSLASLREAVQRSPTNALACARLALGFLEQLGPDNTLRIGDADFLSRRALQLAPADPEVQRIRSRIENFSSSALPESSPAESGAAPARSNPR